MDALFITPAMADRLWLEQLAEMRELAQHDSTSELMGRLAEHERFAKSLKPASSVAATTQPAKPSKPSKPSQAELEKRWHAQQARRHAQQVASNERLHNRQYKIGR